MDDFTIIKTAWLTQQPGREDLKDRSISLVFNTIKFLQDNQLMNTKLIDKIEDVVDDTELKASHLTDEGLEFMKTGYQKWGGKIDRGGDPADTKLLYKYLDQMRSGK